MNLVSNWEITKQHLDNAFSFIPTNGLSENDLSFIKDFNDYIYHNELKLAFDSLDELAEINKLPKEFWKEMILAARQMKLEKHIQRCQEKLEIDD